MSRLSTSLGGWPWARRPGEETSRSERLRDGSAHWVTTRPDKLLWVSQSWLYFCVGVCTLVRPGVVASGGGVTNFGNAWSTAMIYSAGFLVAAAGLGLAGSELSAPDRPILLLITSLVVLVWASTFLRHTVEVAEQVHVGLAVALFGVEFAYSLVLVSRWRGVVDWALLGCEVGGLVVCLASLLNVLKVLYVGQVVASLGFGLLLCLRATRPPGEVKVEGT